jgi:ribonuclease P/MRP protein subunit RPP1
MKSYDYCILASSDEIIRKAEGLGWDGVCILESGTAVKEMPRSRMDVMKGLLIETAKPDEARSAAQRARKIQEIVAVRGLNEDVNRIASETPEVDILLPGPGARIDFVMVKLARKNNVAVGFDFSQLLHSSRRERSSAFSVMLENAKIVKKFGAPFVLTSGAVSEWDLRAPSELAAFGRVLGLDAPSIREAMSGKMAEENRKRLGGKWVMPGVEVE